LKQTKILTKTRILNWWLIVLGILEIIFGTEPLWDRGGRWGGDYMLAAFLLNFIALLGFITFISGIFLLEKKTWAWVVAILSLVLAIFILGSDCYTWLGFGSGSISAFEQLFGYKHDFIDFLYVAFIFGTLLVSLVLLLVNVKKFFVK
jgi:hypothetical protein